MYSIHILLDANPIKTLASRSGWSVTSMTLLDVVMGLSERVENPLAALSVAEDQAQYSSVLHLGTIAKQEQVRRTWGPYGRGSGI